MSFYSFLQKRMQNRDEEGIALFGVVIISAFVFTVIMSVAGTSAINSTVTSNSRSSIEVMAAAEAGRDTVLASLSTSACVAKGTVTESPTSPAYSWQVYRYKSVAGEAPTSISQAGVVAGCPNYTSTHLLIKTTGVDRKSQKTIVSTYRWFPNGSSPLQAAVGSGRDLPLSNTEILLPPDSTTPGDVIVTTGTFSCLGSSTRVQGSVYVLQGAAELGGCSTINGGVSTAGDLTFGGNSDRIVDKNVCTKSTIYKYKPGNVGGTVKQNQSYCPGLDFAGWVDYDPTSEITNVVSGTQCSQIAALATAATTPIVIDAQACGAQVTIGSLVIKTDVTIMARGFSISNVSYRSADGVGYMMNFIVPDKVQGDPDDPDCSAGQSTSKFLQLNMQPPMMGLIYTPCLLTHATGTWSGQIYTGEVQSNFAAGTIYYIPTPAPGLGSDRIIGYPSPVLLSQVEL